MTSVLPPYPPSYDPATISIEDPRTPADPHPDTALRYDAAEPPADLFAEAGNDEPGRHRSQRGQHRPDASPVGRLVTDRRALLLGGVSSVLFAGCSTVQTRLDRIAARAPSAAAPSRSGALGAGQPTTGSQPATSGLPGGSAGPAGPAGPVPQNPTNPRAPGSTPPAAPRVPAAAGSFADQDASYGAGAVTPTIPPGIQLSGPAAAAAAAVPIPSLLSGQGPNRHLLRRTTFGPRPEDLADLEAVGIDAWLGNQLAPESVPDPTGDAAWALFPLAGADAERVRGSIDEYSWDAMYETAQATLARQAYSQRQVYEVVVDVFANLLNVPLPNDAGWDVGPSYHSQVVRKHALGTFQDLLLAAMRHPAMLRFLNNDESRKESVNENLGRELLELHTVGVTGGYTEDDVRNSAYILTGRTVEDGAFLYDAERHYTGPVSVLGWTHPNASAEGGLEVGEDYLSFLATHPATATRVSRALATRMVADDPPASLVDRMAATYLAEGTAIVPVLVVMFSSTEFWSAVGAKVRRPLEDVTGSLRTLDATLGQSGDPTQAVKDLYWQLQDLGHAPIGWLPPNGYPDVSAAWNSAGAMLGRWNVHRGLIQGWWEGLGVPGAAMLAGPDQARTYGEYVDSLCTRLTGQAFEPMHRDALLGFLEKGAAEPVPDPDLEGMAAHVAPLVLDAPYFQLR